MKKKQQPKKTKLRVTTETVKQLQKTELTTVGGGLESGPSHTCHPTTMD